MTSMAGLLSSIAEASLASSAVAATFLAVAFHATIQEVEFEQHMFQFLTAAAASGPLLSAFYLGFGGLSAVSALGKAILVVSTFHGSLAASIMTYRLCFHRCCKFPGPVGACLTRFYATSLSLKNVQYFKELEQMHATYGDFVRTGKISRERLYLLVGPPAWRCRCTTLNRPRLG